MFLLPLSIFLLAFVGLPGPRLHSHLLSFASCPPLPQPASARLCLGLAHLHSNPLSLGLHLNSFPSLPLLRNVLLYRPPPPHTPPTASHTAICASSIPVLFFLHWAGSLSQPPFLRPLPVYPSSASPSCPHDGLVLPPLGGTGTKTPLSSPA